MRATKRLPAIAQWSQTYDATTKLMVRPDGFEPPTPWFEARYSIQLSYGRAPAVYLVVCPPATASSNYYIIHIVMPQAMNASGTLSFGRKIIFAK